MNMRFAQIALAVLLTLLCIVPTPQAQAGSVPDGGNVQITDAGLGKDNAEQPQLAVVGETIYSVWLDDRDNSHNGVYFAKSTDGGATWGANVLVSNLGNPNRDDWVDSPALAVQPNGTIYVLWYRYYREDSTQTDDVRLGISTDGGATFTVGTLIKGDATNVDLAGARIAVDPSDSRIYVLHNAQTSQNSSGYDIFLTAYDADGKNGRRVRVNDVVRSGHTYDEILYGGPQLSLTVRNGVICAAWEDSRNRFSIYGACSADKGVSFGANSQVSGADSARPQIALAPDGALYATYTAAGGTNPTTITLRRSADRAATWATPTTVVSVDSGTPVRGWDLGVDNAGQVVLPWSAAGIGYGGSGSATLYTSVDGGANFAATKLNDGQGQYASIAKQSGIALALGDRGGVGRAYVAW